MRGVSLLGVLWIVIGLIVAATHHFFDHVSTVGGNSLGNHRRAGVAADSRGREDRRRRLTTGEDWARQGLPRFPDDLVPLRDMNPGGGGITGEEPWAWEESRWRG